MLTDPQKYNEAWQQLKDSDSFVQLKIMLTAALQTRKNYQELGIDQDVFLATMKCFTRFINEHFSNYGYYNFDRGFWVGRQLSSLLFRLGELEYELFTWEGENVISIHIPSDCDLSPQKIDKSLEVAKQFFEKFPSHANARFFCYSWLISPNLKLILPSSSKIIMFQDRFEVVQRFDESNGFVQWVFKQKDLAIENYPEDTSLQRNMKTHLLNGGRIGEAVGFLK